ncbi:MAG: hypothetical protein ACRDHW_08340, partial [Ktedonobacteraceae bacterium]
MHDEQPTSSSDDNNQSVLAREQHLVEQIKQQLQNFHEPAPESLEQILLALPEKYQTMALQAMAERFTNSMKLHLLSLTAQFYQSAEAEG